jgi:hypothetical protein
MIGEGMSNEDRETHINWTGQDRQNKVMTIYTDDPVEYGKLIKKGYEPTKHTDVGAFFEIEYRLVTIRKNAPKRQLSEEQKARLRSAAPRKTGV